MGKLKGMKELFAGRHFDREIIVLCVRWYLRSKLSLRDLVEMMAERSCILHIPRSCAGCRDMFRILGALESLCTQKRLLMAC